MGFTLELVNQNVSKKNSVEGLKNVLWKSMNKMEEIAKIRCPVDTGRLRNSIHLIPSYSGATSYILSDGVDYGIHVEYGTMPHIPPISPLIGWSRRVLRDSKAAYAVRAKISKEGTDAQPFFRPAYHEVQFKWIQVFANKEFALA